MNELIDQYWSARAVWANIIVIAHLAGAFGLGIIMGFERVYHGRAAGMRTYALVCTAACGLTIACAYPGIWFGGQGIGGAGLDPTRIIQGVMTGIGFLGAGVIMREGHTITGLSTAASIWMAAAIGTLVGLGFYLAAIVAALMTTFAMASFRGIETMLPHYALMRLSVRLAGAGSPGRAELDLAVRNLGFEIKDWTLNYDRPQGELSYELTVQSSHTDAQQTLVATLQALPFVRALSVAPVRD